MGDGRVLLGFCLWYIVFLNPVCVGVNADSCILTLAQLLKGRDR